MSENPADGVTTRQGWQCPGCKRCYAPFVTMCGYCAPAAPPARQHVFGAPGADGIRECQCGSGTKLHPGSVTR